MRRNYAIAACAVLMSPAGWAACTLYSGQPTTLNIPAQVIRIAADAPVDNTLPIAEYNSNQPGFEIWYTDCDTGSRYGKRVVGLSMLDAANKIYKTNIPGIGIRPRYSNSLAFGLFPSDSAITFENNAPSGKFHLNAGAFYQIQFFKTGELQLNNGALGDLVMPSGIIGYNYILTPTQASSTLTLNIGEVRIISTPSCTVSGAKNISFDTVTPSLLSAGVVRPLDFDINCTSDYGSYSAKAAITTQTPSPDASYIQAEDSAGNRDRLAIYITDGAQRPMKVNGSTFEMKNAVTSRTPAEFKWQAKLMPGSGPSPSGGTFTAKAEIVFDIQ